MSPHTHSPRAGYESVGGIPWLARMIDKARLEASGQIDQFDLEYPCPMDRSLLRQLEIDAKTFQAIALQHQSDADILNALQTAGARLDV